MLYICIFSNKFDLKQTIRVLHKHDIFVLSFTIEGATKKVPKFSDQVLTLSHGQTLANRTQFGSSFQL